MKGAVNGMEKEILLNRYQKSEIVGFYGLESIEKERKGVLQENIHQYIIQLYGKGYRCFAVASVQGFSLLAFRELVNLQIVYKDITILLFELIDLNMEEWENEEKEEYDALCRSASVIIHTMAEKRLTALSRIAAKLLVYCNHLVCYFEHNSKELQELQKLIDIIAVLNDKPIQD